MPPELVVRTDRRAVNRWNGGIVGLHVAVTVVIVAILVVLGRLFGDTPVSPLVFSPFVILLLGQMFQVGVYCYVWGAGVAINRPLTVTTDGLVVELSQGRAEIDWVAVARIETRSLIVGQALVIHLHPGAVNGAPGVRTEIRPRTWQRMLRRGIALGSRGIDCDLEQIRQAMARASAGRVLV